MFVRKNRTRGNIDSLDALEDKVPESSAGLYTFTTGTGEWVEEELDVILKGHRVEASNGYNCFGPPHKRKVHPIDLVRKASISKRPILLCAIDKIELVSTIEPVMETSIRYHSWQVYEVAELGI